MEILLPDKFLAFTSTKRESCLYDVVDLLHCSFTSFIIMIFALFVGTKQQFGQPIQCMLPAHLDRKSWNAYTQHFCLIEGTYRLTYNKTIPNVNDRMKPQTNARINYYQWIPLFLAMQALCFQIPAWLWTILQKQRSFDMEAAVKEAVFLKRELKLENRTRKLKDLVQYIASDLKLKISIAMHKKKWHYCYLGKVNGLSVVLYLISKLTAIINNALQLYIIGRFIGFESLFWALTVNFGCTYHLDEVNLSHEPIAAGKRYFGMTEASHYFPVVTFCDLERRTVNENERSTLQCVLMLNFIIEKIFFMLWYWLLMNGKLNEKDYMLLKDKKCLDVYINKFLGLDGAFLLRFVDKKAGSIIASDIAVGLWHSFAENYFDSKGSKSAADIEIHDYKSSCSPLVSLSRPPSSSVF
ncbi:unnamed protein product [Thelazia callipaeda]|uniref:Innexin n=1 Tax=Thelazia callipaeda TaxID=103827 RepID=A0A0N5DB56_THECL|nr:unnamed protein product [Thelazia callipaeda]